LVVAEEHLKQYLEFAVRLYKEIRQDPVRYAKLKALLEANHQPRVTVLSDEEAASKRRSQKIDSPQVDRGIFIDILKPKRPPIQGPSYFENCRFGQVLPSFIAPPIAYHARCRSIAQRAAMRF